ncbi:amino acid permease-domain-containing protein [Fusarium oxysporum]|nr:amino acid permease-domain-containing protein [Fusarium oxysporum]
MLTPREHATAVNKAPIVRAMTALLMVISIQAATIRIVTRVTTVGSLSLDDGLVAASTVLAVIQSIIVIFEGSAGLGKRDGIDTDQISLILKSQYASNILFITVLFLAKISATRTIRSMASRERQRLVLITEGVISLWALGSIVASLFECSLPKPWDYIHGKCFNRALFWTVVDIVNIMTDIIVTGILIDMFKSLQTSRSKKFLVIGVFGCRILITPAIICHIYYFRKATNLNKPLFDMWAPTVIIQVIQCMSIMVTCVPFLKPFMDSLESGQMNAGDGLQTRTRGSDSRSRTDETAPRTLRGITTLASNASYRRQNYEMVDADNWGAKKDKGTTASATAVTTEQSRPWDGQSHTSQSVLVHQTWQVEIERQSTHININGGFVREEVFKLWKLLCAVLVTWEGILMSLAPGLANGGPGGLIYGFTFVWIGNLSVFSTLCELVSIAPTSGGQYHWVAMLAPRSCSKFLSYITGWLTLAGWQGTCAASSYLTGTMLQGVIVFMVPSYTAQTWQGTLIAWLLILIAIFVNTVISSMLPKLEGMILILHIVGFFAVLISLVTFGANGDAEHIFLEFRNTGGWSTQGLSWCMCEEVKNPSVAVPRSIMTSIVINGSMGLAIIIAMLYGATDIDKAISSATGYPSIEIIYQATGSMGGTAAITSFIITMSVSCLIGTIAATSRVFWSFARDHGLPFWPTLSQVNSWTGVPVWAIGITSIISCLLALINIGSTAVYNAIISIAVSSLYSSYLMAASLLLYRRVGKGFKLPDPSAFPALADTGAGEGQTLAWGRWHVPGVFGIINNTYACLYLALIWFFSFWPPAANPNVASMNFAVLITGCVFIFSVIYYLTWARREYKGPVVENLSE